MSNQNNRRKFTPQQKEEILATAKVDGPKAAAAKHGVGESLIHKWKSGEGMRKVSKPGYEVAMDGDYIVVSIPKKDVARELFSGLL
ncbi:MAG: transposase [Oligoflexus sp.]